MNPLHLVRRPLTALALSAIAAGVLVQAQVAQQFKPQVGQAGKDVVWVPTAQPVVEKMLDMAQVAPQDYVIDLGSGDGRTVIAAAKRGAHALGIEYNPEMIELSRQNAEAEGVSSQATFVKADLFESDFSQATVITMFLLPELNLRLRPTLLNLKPGTRIVSNTFTMGEWEPDETATVSDGCSSWCTALLWIVPAKVDGTWRLPHGELVLKQDFQMVSGTLTSGNGALSITGGRLRGDRITFSVGDAVYTGRVRGDAMAGTVKSDGTSGNWTAVHAGKAEAARGR
jgi:SAM-dependent methyltransferase